jgi:hypothetical protein
VLQAEECKGGLEELEVAQTDSLLEPSKGTHLADTLILGLWPSKW